MESAQQSSLCLACMISLSLYIHIPWCLRKCPYCDFHSLSISKDQLPEKDYLDSLLRDLENDLQHIGSSRPLQSIFIGGGTPSLLSPDGIYYLLENVKKRFIQQATKSAEYTYEITLETNPGTVDRNKLLAFRQAGINRLSIGIQSFDDHQLSTLKRLHSAQQAKETIRWAQEIGFPEINLDLMHGLPNQTVEDALNDLKSAIALNPTHMSWYNLTIEENTPFGKNPPAVPPEDKIITMQQQGENLLQEAGYEHYEISAYAKSGHECHHNLNYWNFGDYIGIGAAAHGKVTHSNPFTIIRTTKIKDPMKYINTSNHLEEERIISQSDLPLEFMMNALRLLKGFSLELFEERTHLPVSVLDSTLKRLIEKGLLIKEKDWLHLTSLGKRFLNDVLIEF